MLTVFCSNRNSSVHVEYTARSSTKWDGSAYLKERTRKTGTRLARRPKLRRSCFVWRHACLPFALYTNQLITSPAAAAKIAKVVIQPSIFMARPLTRFPMMAGLFVIRKINSMRGGVEKP